MNATTTALTLAEKLDDILAGDPVELDAAVTLQELVDESSEEAVLAFVENYGEHYYPLEKADDWADNFRESYLGEMTAREYAEQLVEEGVFGDVAPGLTSYIDYDQIAHDLLMGDCWESESGHLFRSF